MKPSALLEYGPFINTNIIPQPILKHAFVFMCLQYKSFENTVGKGEIARNEQFLLFPTVFSSLLENFLPFSSTLNCCLETLTV